MVGKISQNHTEERANSIFFATPPVRRRLEQHFTVVRPTQLVWRHQRKEMNSGFNILAAKARISRCIDIVCV
jgi:hypothetical protein